MSRKLALSRMKWSRRVEVPEKNIVLRNTFNLNLETMSVLANLNFSQNLKHFLNLKTFKNSWLYKLFLNSCSIMNIMIKLLIDLIMNLIAMVKITLFQKEN